MTTLNTERYEELLRAKARELRRGRPDLRPIAIEQTPEEYEQMVFAAERELALVNLERGSKLAREVDAALRRIEEGAYGICESCEEEISAKRLQALPWARYCVVCQEQHDRGPFWPERLAA
jgi:DnaK suppressor protein